MGNFFLKFLIELFRLIFKKGWKLGKEGKTLRKEVLYKYKPEIVKTIGNVFDALFDKAEPKKQKKQRKVYEKKERAKNYNVKDANYQLAEILITGEKRFKDISLSDVVIKGIKNDKEIAYTGEQTTKKAFNIYKKENENKPVSANEKKFTELYEKIITEKNKKGDKIIDLNKWNPIASSWIMEGYYNLKLKCANFVFIRGKAHSYFFPNFPLKSFMLLVTADEHAGTLWGRRFYWKYSIYAAKGGGMGGKT